MFRCSMAAFSVINAAVRTKAVISILFIRCFCSSYCVLGFLYWVLFCGVVLVVISSLAIIVLRKTAGCFTPFVMWLSVFYVSSS